MITGVKGCGKSYLLDVLFRNYLLTNGYTENQIFSINLEDDTYSLIRNPIDLGKYLRSILPKDKKAFLFIDEIQRCETIANPAFIGYQTIDGHIPTVSFYSVLNGLLNNYPNVEIFVTGSNSKMLSTDVLTDFRGRGWEIKLYPLSFKEYVEADESTDKKLAFEQYLTYGSMPAILSLESEREKIAYLNNLMTETYIKDVVERNKLSSDDVLRNVLELVASNTGSLMTINKLTNTFKSAVDKNISRAQLSTYITYLEEAMLIDEVRRYDIRGKRLLSSGKKYYFVDTGLRNSLLNYRQKDYGHLMESIIYYELKRRGYSVNIGAVDVFETNKDNTREEKHLEIDFIAESGDKRFYIQSAYEINNEEKLIQESRSLLKVNDCFRKLIIENDLNETYYDKNGILHIGIIEFLLNEDILKY